jgi:hypothetical protein
MLSQEMENTIRAIYQKIAVTKIDKNTIATSSTKTVHGFAEVKTSVIVFANNTRTGVKLVNDTNGLLYFKLGDGGAEAAVDDYNFKLAAGKEMFFNDSFEAIQVYNDDTWTGELIVTEYFA